MRRPVCISLFLFLVACRSAPQPQAKVVEEINGSNQGRIVVGDTLGTGRMIRQPRPVYPKEAKKARIQGIVKLAIVITKTGDVSDIHVLSGNPALVRAAVEAVKQWKYAPHMLNGESVEVKTQIDISFTLSQ